MKSISQRELRNESGEVMRQVTDGASFRVTSRGVPVATLAPIGSEPAEPQTVREGTQKMEFPRGVRVAESTEAVLAELRGER